MNRLTTTCLSLTLACAASAGAATPAGDGSYVGKLSKSDAAKTPTLLLQVAPNAKELLVLVACGKKHPSFDGVKIDSSGAFSATGKLDGAKTTIAGRFVAENKARGTISTSACKVGSDVPFFVKL